MSLRPPMSYRVLSLPCPVAELQRKRFKIRSGSFCDGGRCGRRCRTRCCPCPALWQIRMDSSCQHVGGRHRGWVTLTLPLSCSCRCFVQYGQGAVRGVTQGGDHRVCSQAIRKQGQEAHSDCSPCRSAHLLPRRTASSAPCSAPCLRAPEGY